MIWFLLAAGDEAEGTKLLQCYELYKNQMFYVARAIVPDNYLAEDVVQNAFLRIIKNGHISKLDDPHSVQTKAYLCKAAKTCALDIQRSLSSKRYCSEYILDKLPDGASSEYEYTDLILLISVFVQKLSDTDKTILYMKFQYEFTDQAIADAVSLPLTTVKKRIHKMRGALCKEIGDGGVRVEPIRNETPI